VLPHGYQLAAEILDELLWRGLGIHTLEPLAALETVTRARPNLYYTRKQPETGGDKLSIFMKKEVAKLPNRDREIGKQVAGVIEDIIEAVEFGHDKIGLKL
jgi:hypothetical protein